MRAYSDAAYHVRSPFEKQHNGAVWREKRSWFKINVDFDHPIVIYFSGVFDFSRWIRISERRPGRDFASRTGCIELKRWQEIETARLVFASYFSNANALNLVAHEEREREKKTERTKCKGENRNCFVYSLLIIRFLLHSRAHRWACLSEMVFKCVDRWELKEILCTE